MSYQQAAAACGFTVEIMVQAGSADLEGWAKPGADYDDRFDMYCADTGEILWVKGWACLVEEV